MAVARMDRILLMGLRKDQAAIVAALTKIGAVSIEENSELKDAYLSAMQSLDHEGDATPSLAELADGPWETSAEPSTSDLLKDVPSATASGAELADWGRGEGSTSGGAISTSARFYFYDMMQQMAHSDEIAAGERLPQAGLANPELLKPEEIPHLRGLCQSHMQWLVDLIPQAIRLLEQAKPMFTLKRYVEPSAYSDAGMRQAEILEAAAGLEAAVGDMDRIRKEIEQIHAGMTVIEPWRALTLPSARFDAQQDWGIRSLTGSFPSMDAVRELEAQVREQAAGIAVEVLGTSETDAVAAVVVYLNEDERQVHTLLDEAHFAELPRLTGLQVSQGDYKSAWEQQRQRVTRLEEELEQVKQRGAEFAKHKEDFEVLHDFYQVQDAKLRAMDSFISGDHVFVLNGYVPQALSSNVAKAISDRYSVVVELQEVEADEDYPIILQNHPLVKPFESVVRTFSLPKPGHDADPTAVMAPFYTILFGLMLGDVGYGALLAILCAVLLWKVKVQDNFRQMTMVLFMGGLASIPMGFLFGSFFGDAVTTVTGGAVNFPTLLLNPLEEPIQMLILSMGVGLLHLFAGLALDIRVKLGMGDWQTALFAVAPWYLILTGLILLIVGQDWGKWIAIAGAGIILFLGTAVRNPIKRIMGGLGALYGITGWLSDLLSYARVLALALATSVIAMVVNMMAMLPGYKGISIIFFIAIMIFGHLLNLALSGLSAYVHTTRLQYVELFGKFYEGGGRAFEPLNYKTRFTRALRTEAEQDAIEQGQFKRIPAKFAQADAEE